MKGPLAGLKARLYERLKARLYERLKARRDERLKARLAERRSLRDERLTTRLDERRSQPSRYNFPVIRPFTFISPTIHPTAARRRA